VTLPTGDYSLEGYADRVAVERKTLADLYTTLGQGRERFECELQRLAAMQLGFVVVEADWRTIVRRPPAFSRLNPKTVYRSVIAWQQRFPNVHWWACPNRRFAEVTTLRVLERFQKDAAAPDAAASGAAGGG
jgi:ERCC4-type nuclease